ncbi:protein of unknown function [Pseudodesulfovibrio piezophilus C1TLV30]|uniref:Uncharacterized protein n=1 Tax=Pseudodesulfovibrio piezophilus (strain DSM 21447 / JCM 15486 / C1TLV30) TaxID=1322246 RepID=M1WJL3_PSEP2|nr:protein of unknown function [Pseudodesulfovibrio piezophilus C1TLV30]
MLREEMKAISVSWPGPNSVSWPGPNIYDELFRKIARHNRSEEIHAHRTKAAYRTSTASCIGIFYSGRYDNRLPDRHRQGNTA